MVSDAGAPVDQAEGKDEVQSVVHLGQPGRSLLPTGCQGLTRGLVIRLGSREPGCCLLRRAPGSSSCRSGGVCRRARQHAAGRRRRSVERLAPRPGRPPVGTSWFRPRSHARKTTSNSNPPSRSIGLPLRHPGNRAERHIRCCQAPPTQDRAVGRRRKGPPRKYEAPGHARSLVCAKQFLDTPVGDVLPSVELLRVAGQQDLKSFLAEGDKVILHVRGAHPDAGLVQVFKMARIQRRAGRMPACESGSQCY